NKRFPPWAKLPLWQDARNKRFPPWAKPPLWQDARNRRFPPWAKPPLWQDARNKRFPPWAKPPLWQDARNLPKLPGNRRRRIHRVGGSDPTAGEGRPRDRRRQPLRHL